jgi:type VI secretion system secreted protein Hcp
MSLPAYCRIEGDAQGLITEGNMSEESVGPGWQEGHEDEIRVQSFTQEVTVPHEAHSTGPSGHRRNGPVVITKEVDKSTPLLHQALVQNELLTKVEFTFFRASSTGVAELFFKITLEDATVSSIRDMLPDTLDAGNTRFPMTQEVKFMFRKIEWSHELASTMSHDEWRDPSL